MIEQGEMQLDLVCRDPAKRDELLPLLPLLLLREGADHELPGWECMLQPGDQLLFAGTREARTAQNLTLDNPAQNLTLDNRNVLDYVLTGKDAEGWVWRWLCRMSAS